MIKTRVNACDVMIGEFNYLIVKKELDLKIMTRQQITEMTDDEDPKKKVTIDILGQQINKLRMIVTTLTEMRKQYVKENEKYE